jgi:hypothetical protein
VIHFRLGRLFSLPEELAESLRKPWRLIEETAYAVGKELGLRIRRGAGGETYFSKKPL